MMMPWHHSPLLTALPLVHKDNGDGADKGALASSLPSHACLCNSIDGDSMQVSTRG